MTHAAIAITDPTERVDNSPLAPSDIKSIEWFDTASSDPSVPFATQDGPQTEFDTGPLTPGDHGFSFVVVNGGGRRSAPSNVAMVTVPQVIANPKPGTIDSVTLVDDSGPVATPVATPVAAHVVGPS